MHGTREMPIDPWTVLTEAIRRVPAVKYALAVAGVAAASALVIQFVGYGKAGVIVISGTFIAMILMYIFSRLVVSPGDVTTLPGIIMLYAVIAFFCAFLFFTVTAFAFLWPSPWAEFLGLVKRNDCFDSPAQYPEFPQTRTSSFTYNATNPGMAGPRYWNRSGETWTEKTPSYPDNHFTIMKRINYSGCDGSVISRSGDENFQAFIPDKACPSMSLRFRVKPNACWSTLPPMQNVE